LLAKENDIDFESEEFMSIDVRVMDLQRLSAITTAQIYDFLMYTGNTRGNQSCAKARKLSSIKGLYKYLVNKRNYLEFNPAQNIETPKSRKSLPKFLTLEESLSLLECVQNDTNSKSRVRDYAMLTLFLNCGMRVSELVGIKLTDLDPELRSMRVIGKGNKERIIYLNAACRAVLVPLIEERCGPKYSGVKTKALFLSNRNERISVKTVQYIVYKYLAMAGLEAKHYSVHKLRHTAATLMYQSGQVDVRVLKDILGYVQLNTTQIYTHVSDEHMQSAMEMNPLADKAKPLPKVSKPKNNLEDQKS
jgi:site-specific recombinase XerD